MTESNSHEEAVIRDADLVCAARKGDREAYAELIRLHQPRVLRTCFSMLANAAEAEDAAQDAFVKAYESLRRFNGLSSFATWVGRIASNHCLDLLRSRTRRKTQSLDVLLDDEDHFFEVPAPGPLLHTVVENEQLIKTVLSTLTPDQREILVLREVQGLRYDEISSALHCTINAVKSRLRRAREALERSARHFSKTAHVYKV